MNCIVPTGTPFHEIYFKCYKLTMGLLRVSSKSDIRFYEVLNIRLVLS